MSDYDLVIVGAGSGNMIADHRFDDWRIAIVDAGPFGGTCLNRGCIPSKMYAHTGEVAATAADGPRLGVRTSYDGADWPAIRDRIMGRIDENAAGGRDGQAKRDNIDVVVGEARFTGPRTLTVDLEAGGERTLTADRVVLATGSRPVVPPIDGLEELGGADHGCVHTSDSIMRLDALPRRMAVVGGGYVGSEFADVFHSLGVEVLQVESAERLLSTQDREVADLFTASAADRWDVRLGTQLTRVEAAGDGAGGDGLRLHLDDGSTETVGVLLLATGRRPNSDRLDLDGTGIDVDDAGRIVVDAHQRATADGVWALGDASSPFPLKHVANHEARVVQHNLLHPDAPVETDHRFVPQAVFASPQVAAAGLTEEQAREEVADLVVGRAEYGATAHGWALEEDDRHGEATGHVVKLLADRATGLLVGAHLIGPQASVLIQPLLQAMALGTPVAGLARAQYWIHPALTEVLEGALLDLDEQLAG